MSHYETLGVAQTATPDEIKTAYRKLAKQYHPDLGGDVSKFQAITEAYEVLIDLDKKRHYDYQLKNFNRSDFQSRSVNDDFEFIFKDFPFFRFDDLQKQKNKNIKVIIEIPFLDTLNPQTKIIDLTLSKGNESLEIKIPAGIEDGSNMSVRGKGDNEFSHLPRGNLEIQIKVIPHPRFSRQGYNLVTDVTVDCFEAVVGTEVNFSTPDGTDISLKIPAGTQTNTVFGITDQGFPSYPKNTRGKLLIRCNIRVPQNLTKEQIDLVNQIIKLKPINS